MSAPPLAPWPHADNRRKSARRCSGVTWSASCSTRCMPSPIRRALVIVATILCTAIATAAHAQLSSQTPSPRIRPETAEARALLDELLARSPTAQQLADHLEESDVIVYVRFRWFATE